MEPIQQNQKQDFDFLLILDFEATCDDKTDISTQEIIEFPVVPYDLNKNEIWTENYFHYYIKPTINPKLTKFCTELTGIEQEEVDKGIPISDAISKLTEYLKKTKIWETNFTFVTVGSSDLEKFLIGDCKAKNVNVPTFMKNYINIMRKFPRKLMPVEYHKSTRCIGLRRMMEQLNLEFIGKQHSGLYDCINTARICQTLINQHQFLFQFKMRKFVQQGQNQDRHQKNFQGHKKYIVKENEVQKVQIQDFIPTFAQKKKENTNNHYNKKPHQKY